MILNNKDICDVPGLKVAGWEGRTLKTNNLELMEICCSSAGLTGRTLRKIPFLAHALYLTGDSISLAQFLKALRLIVEKRKNEVLQYDDKQK